MFAAFYYFEERSENDFKDEAVVSCHLGKLFQCTRCRHAYYGLPTFEPLPFMFDLDRTKSTVEKRREKGANWEIEEIPLIIFGGQQRASLVVGQRGKDPFVAFLPLRKRCLTLERAAEFFTAPAFRIVCEKSVVPPGRLPFCSHKSRSRGGNYPLSWCTSVEADLKLDAPLRLIARFSKHIQKFRQP